MSRSEFEARMLSEGRNITAIVLTSMPPKFLAYFDKEVQKMWEEVCEE